MSTKSGNSPSQSKFSERRRGARREEDRHLLRRNRELQAACRISHALSEHLYLDELIERTLTIALEVVEAESGSILLAAPDSKELVFRHSIGTSRVQVGTAIPWDKGIAGAVFHRGEPIVIGDVKEDQRHFPDIDILTQHVTRDMIALPLKRWEGQSIGVLEILNKSEGLLDQDDLAILSIISAIAASSIEHAHLYQEAKLAEVVRILGDISHDIKNMLMPVVTGTGLLQAEVKDLFARLPDPERNKAAVSYHMCKEVFVMVENSTRRIQDRVREIADCVKGLSSPPEFAPCQVESVVKGVFEVLSWFADQKGLTLLSEGFDALPQLVADERRLFNAFYNLINNAIPEVPVGGTILVSGEEDPEGAGILISVADTGRGMSPEIRDSLFSLHTRSQKPGGTGLGTKIVKDVVDAHGGWISVESQVGIGTTFRLFLPFHPPQSRKNL